MKKLVAILTLCLLCAICAFGFAACEEESGGNTPAPDTPTHTHEYMEMVITPTCTTDGYTMHVCTCKDWYKDNETPALGHNYEWTITKEPTETEEGVKTGVCTRCGDTITQSIPASNHEHNYIITVVPATCTAGGYTAHKCACGNEYTDNETPALGHNYEWETTKQPTCTEKGEKTATCTRCHETKTEEINATGHKFTNYVSDGNATFESDGTKTAYCNYGCGAKDTIPDVGSKLSEIEEFFTKQQDGTYYGKVFNKTTTFNFTNKIKGGIEYYVCTDAACTKTLTNNIANLNVGDNVFYVLFADGNKTTATVRRRAICTVNFNSAGGTAVSSQNIEEDRRATAPKSPMRLGYTFNSWDRDFNKPITSDTTITAIWNANTNTPYKVEYYLQNLEDDNYTLTDTANLTGTTDTTVTITKTYEHFTVVETTASANIKPDGSTVLQVKYTRDKYTFTVQNENSKGGTITGTQSGTYKFNKEISLSATLNAGYDFDGWYNGETKLTDNLQYSFNIEESITITAKYCAHTDTPYKVAYYLENLDGSYTRQDSDTENLTGTTDTTAIIRIEKTYEHYIIGNIVLGNINGNGSTIVKVYYNLEKFKIHITSNSNVELSQHSGYYKYGYIIPEITATLCLGYNWQGWYCDNEFMQTDYKIPSFTVDKNINLVAHCAVKDEMSNFNFTSTPTTCTITGIKDKTVTEIIVPDYVTEIKNGAFSGCSSLESITIPFVGAKADVTSSDQYQYPFGYIFGERSYTGGTATEQYYYHFSTSSTIINNYYIPSTLKSVMVTSGNIIYGSFYNCSSITSITIGNGVTSIGNSEFYNCSSLTSVTIPDSVTNIGNYAFYNCSSLTSITVSKNNIKYKSIDGNLYSKDGTVLIQYAIGKTATEFTISDSVTSIGDSAFKDCSSLTSITIPDSVTSIGDYAFYDCSSLTSITIPNSVTTIGERAFYHCSNMTSINFAENSQLTSIGFSAFYDCSKLASIIIPDGVMNIGYEAFCGCNGLTSMTIPFVGATKDGTSNTHFGYIFGARDIEDIPYFVPSSLKTVIITNCDNIGSGAFWGCNYLTSVIIRGSVTSIGIRAFYSCRDLASVIIENGVTSIGAYAFSSCRSLARVAIPVSVTSIGKHAFYTESKRVDDIIFNGTKQQWRVLTENIEWIHPVPGNTYTIHCIDGNIVKN